MKPLETVNQHRAVLLVEHIAPDLDDVVRRDPDHVPVKSSVVECAERHAVRDGRHTMRIRVCHDVRRVEELFAAKPADRAVMLIRPHNALAELALVQTLLKEPSGITAADLGFPDFR